MRFISARLFAFLAPFLPIDEHFAAGNFIGNAIRNENIIIKSGGGSIRSYQYGTDLVTWLWALLVRGKSGDAYNVGSDESLSIKELAEKVVEVSASGISVKIMGKDEVANISQYVPSISKVSDNLGMKNSVNSNDAISRTLSFLSELK